MLARDLKSLFFENWTKNPALARRAAAALEALTSEAPDAEVGALAVWVAGVARQLDGQMEASVAQLSEAEARFERLGQPNLVAAVQVSKVGALARLGRYDEAVGCGRQARDVFVALGDQLAAGKIEQNLGNIAYRREQYGEAERLYRAARERYLLVGDQKQLAEIENNLAATLSQQHRFREAEPLYEQALARARAGGLEVTQAEIEGDLGYLALFRGHYDRALDYLERARRRYAALGMRHKSANAERELADAYVELNLGTEAAAAYARVVPVFAELGLRAEQAAALTHHARALLIGGEPDAARELLAKSRTLYAAEDNEVGAATVTLIEAQIHHAEGRFEAAAVSAAVAEARLAAGNRGRLLLARWLLGDARRALGQRRAARRILEETLQTAQQEALPHIAYRCHTSLGLLAAAAGDGEAAEAAFERAVTLIESVRAALPGEEFRTAFVADKLTPYTELVRINLDDPDAPRVAQALGYAERARSRALVDMLGGALPVQPRARDEFEAGLLARLSELRQDLSWLYSQINRRSERGEPASPAAVAELDAAVRDRETRVLEILRQLQQRGDSGLVSVQPLDLARLQRDLGSDTALVEYYVLHGEVLAFLVTEAGVEVVRDLATEDTVGSVLDSLRFQLEAMRYGVQRVQAHLEQLERRTRQHLARLYDLLLRPIEPRLADRRLVVVPYRALHYVPFHALYDGTEYVIERREVCYVPSASVLRHCLEIERRPLRRGVLLGVPDEQTPHVLDEVAALAKLLPEFVTLVGEEATLDALRREAPGADVLHLACHGQFRPESPLFSALRLADSWLTVRDAYELDLDGALVTLSACETGASAVAPGDELIGLVRGFFSAGAPSLLVSLWTVDDASTASLMADVYSRLQAGDGPAAALRAAQRNALRTQGHPFFWSPFALFGRW